LGFYSWRAAIVCGRALMEDMDLKLFEMILVFPRLSASNLNMSFDVAFSGTNLIEMRLLTGMEIPYLG
jgi:hypothetical protein